MSPVGFGRTLSLRPSAPANVAALLFLRLPHTLIQLLYGSLSTDFV